MIIMNDSLLFKNNISYEINSWLFKYWFLRSLSILLQISKTSLSILYLSNYMKILVKILINDLTKCIVSLYSLIIFICLTLWVLKFCLNYYRCCCHFFIINYISSYIRIAHYLSDSDIYIFANLLIFSSSLQIFWPLQGVLIL